MFSDAKDRGEIPAAMDGSRPIIIGEPVNGKERSGER